jgi:hypothetical protein
VSRQDDGATQLPAKGDVPKRTTVKDCRHSACGKAIYDKLVEHSADSDKAIAAARCNSKVASSGTVNRRAVSGEACTYEFALDELYVLERDISGSPTRMESLLQTMLYRALCSGNGLAFKLLHLRETRRMASTAKWQIRRSAAGSRRYDSSGPARRRRIPLPDL